MLSSLEEELRHSGELMLRISDELELCYDTFGDPADPPVLLIAGNGAQMTSNRVDTIVRPLVQAGYYVIRHDNRDAGLSSRMPQYGNPHVAKMMGALAANSLLQDTLVPLASGALILSAGLTTTSPTGMQGSAWPRLAAAAALGAASSAGAIRVPVPGMYSLDDMASDSKSICDHLGLKGGVHIVGASMGGMIAQVMAVRYPRLVRSMTCIYSCSDAYMLGDHRPSLSYMMSFLRVGLMPSGTLEEKVEQLIFSKKNNVPPEFYDDAEAREHALEYITRCADRTGGGRQTCAIFLAWDRKEELAKLSIPSLVLHGTGDPLIPPQNGRVLAAAIPGCQSVFYEGMGHNLDAKFNVQMVKEIVHMIRKTEAGERYDSTLESEQMPKAKL